MTGVYYNELDPYCAQWLRNMVAAGELPDGDVDERSIEDVAPADVAGYTQAHFFAGIGGWPLALRLAGWPESRPVWTGSCPCQPYSAAGARGGNDDPRALWWAWRWLIDQCRPVTVAGEQVASAAGREWLAGVRADLDLLGYAFGAADLPAAGVGAPHIRQRLWWVGDSGGSGLAQRQEQTDGRANLRDERPALAEAGFIGRMGDAASRGRRQAGCSAADDHTETGGGEAGRSSGPGKNGNGIPDTAGERRGEAGRDSAQSSQRAPWDSAAWIPCEEPSGWKWRRIEPGIEPLVDGFPGRVDQLRAYGNSIVPQEAAEFLMAYTEAP